MSDETTGEAWEQKLGGRWVRFEVVPRMYVRREGGEARPLALEVDYDEGVVRVSGAAALSEVVKYAAAAGAGFAGRGGGGLRRAA